MSPTKIKYGIDDRPPILQLIAFSIQWLAITVPTLIIVGKVVAGIHFDSSGEQITYLQKLFFVAGISLFLQVLVGHRMPLVIGPATVLLIGIASATGSSYAVVYTSILIGGAALAIISITGLFARLRTLFTPRVVATILVLIAFTLTPMILNLITSSSEKVSAFSNLIFSFLFVLALFLVNKYLKGIWKSTLILWATVLGSFIYILLFKSSYSLAAGTPFLAGFFDSISFSFDLNAGVLLSFFICFLALSINDLGSIQSVGEILKPDDMPKRVTRGITLTGILNVLSGVFGVVGPVNYSLSPGVIASTGVASRFTLVPTALALLGLSFLPKIIALMGSIPSAVIGTVLIYIMCSQIAAGLLVAFNTKEGFSFESGLIMGLPIMLSIITSYLPQSVIGTFPLSLRPIIGNGFVVGVLAVLIMEHVIYRKKESPNSLAK
ncbi:MAG: purine/pyrimidine permease [Peptococcaceae bacterium]|nr:purine/pyrimidine permease [Peptococcaceae bacterium]